VTRCQDHTVQRYRCYDTRGHDRDHERPPTMSTTATCSAVWYGDVCSFVLDMVDAQICCTADGRPIGVGGASPAGVTCPAIRVMRHAPPAAKICNVQDNTVHASKLPSISVALPNRAKGGHAVNNRQVSAHRPCPMARIEPMPQAVWDARIEPALCRGHEMLIALPQPSWAASHRVLLPRRPDP